MKNVILIFVAFIIQNQILHAQNINKDSCTGIRLFLKFENKIENVRKKNNQLKKFISPVDEAIIFESILEKEAPKLINNIQAYCNFLVNILSNKQMKKGNEYDLDLVKILYHLCIDDYITAVDTIYNHYRENKINLNVLLNSIITFEGHYSNIIALNYSSRKLQLLFEKLLNDTLLIKTVEKNNKNFSSTLKAIQSGVIYEAYTGQDKDWFFVIPNKNCVEE